MPLDGLFFTNHGVKTGLSVATVSTPLVYRSFCIEAFEQLAAETAGDEPPLPPVLVAELLPQAASVVPISAVAAAATMMRCI